MMSYMNSPNPHAKAVRYPIPSPPTTMSSPTSYTVDGRPFVELREISAAMLPLELDEAIGLWKILQKTSVDAAKAPNSSIFDFQERCLSLQGIYATIEADKGKQRATQSQAKKDTPACFAIPAVSNEWQYRAGSSSLGGNPFYVPSNYYGSSPTAHVPSNTMYSAIASADYDMGDPPEYASSAEDWNGFLTDEIPITTHPMGHVTLSRPLPPHPEPEQEPESGPTLVGIIYLTLSSHFDREASVGIALKPDVRGKGIGAAALHKILEVVFDAMDFHRVSAGVVNAPATRAPALQLFVGAGFAVEGTRRRAVLVDGDAAVEEWQDAQFLGMLDTEWVMRNTKGASATQAFRHTRWDEMFRRHEREQGELLADEESAHPLKRTASSETLRAIRSASRPKTREVIADSGLESGPDTETETETESESGSRSMRSPSARADSTNSFGNYRTQGPFADDASGHSSINPSVSGKSRTASHLGQELARLASQPSTVSSGLFHNRLRRRSPFPSLPSVSSITGSTSSRVAFIPNEGPFADTLDVAQSLPDTSTSSSEYESAATDSEMFDDSGAHMHVHIGNGPTFNQHAEELRGLQEARVEVGNEGAYSTAVQQSSVRIGSWRERVAAATSIGSTRGVPMPVTAATREQLEEAEASLMDERDGEVCFMDHQAYASLPISNDMTLCVPIQTPMEDSDQMDDTRHLEPIPPLPAPPSIPVEPVPSSSSRDGDEDVDVDVENRIDGESNAQEDTDSDNDYEENFRAHVGLLSGAVSPSRSDDANDAAAAAAVAQGQPQQHDLPPSSSPPSSTSSSSSPSSSLHLVSDSEHEREHEHDDDASNQHEVSENESATWDIVSVSDTGVPSSVSVSSVSVTGASVSLQSASDGEL